MDPRRALEKNLNHPLSNDRDLQKEERRRGKGKGKGKGMKAHEATRSKDPNLPDFDVIVLKEKHRVSNQDINKANEEWVKHLNLIRLCRNEYMEIFKNSMKKGRGEALNAQIKKFSELKNECAEKVAAVSYLGGNAIPFPSHLQKIPALEDAQSK